MKTAEENIKLIHSKIWYEVAYTSALLEQGVKHSAENYNNFSNKIYKIIEEVLTEYKNDIMAEIEETGEAVIELHPYKRRGKWETYSQYNEGWEDGVSLLIENLKRKIKNE